jgi:hypothetical protein
MEHKAKQVSIVEKLSPKEYFTLMSYVFGEVNTNQTLTTNLLEIAMNREGDTIATLVQKVDIPSRKLKKLLHEASPLVRLSEKSVQHSVGIVAAEPIAAVKVERDLLLEKTSPVIKDAGPHSPFIVIDDTFLHTFGSKLQVARLQRGDRLEDLSTRFGIGIANFSRYENRKALPRTENFLHLLDYIFPGGKFIITFARDNNQELDTSHVTSSTPIRLNATIVETMSGEFKQRKAINGHSSEQVSKITGVDRATLSRLQHSDVRNLTAQNLLSLLSYIYPNEIFTL